MSAAGPSSGCRGRRNSRWGALGDARGSADDIYHEIFHVKYFAIFAMVAPDFLRAGRMDQHVSVTVLLTPEVRAAAARHAAHERRPLSAYLRNIIEDHVGGEDVPGFLKQRETVEVR
jgi:hypothetical protein